MPAFINLSKKVRKNVLLISNYLGLGTFCLSSKSKSNLMFKIVFRLLNPALFSKRPTFCPQFTRMLCQSHNKAWSYTNTCAAVIVGTWVADPYDYRREALSTFPNQFETKKSQQKFCLDETVKPRLL